MSCDAFPAISIVSIFLTCQGLAQIRFFAPAFKLTLAKGGSKDMELLRPGERLDDLLVSNLHIIQDTSAFCFSMDAVLLAHFATLRSGDRVVDLGTGTGIIPLLLTTRSPRLSILGVELQAEVAERAGRSVTFNGLQERISIVQGDLRQIGELLPGYRANLITCNPPYLPLGEGQVSLSDGQALARHEVCCQLQDVARAAAYLLGTGGRFALVHRPHRLAEMFFWLNQYRLEPKRLRLVHPRIGTEPNMVLLESVRDARPGLRILPPLYVYEGEDYTPEIHALYFGKGEGV